MRVPYRRVATCLEPMRDAAAVPAVLEVVDEVAPRGRIDDGRDCHGVRPGEDIERVGELGILGRAGGVDDLEEGAGLANSWR